MAIFTVDSDQVLAQSTAVNGTIERIRSEVGSMLGQLTQLESSWTGQAAVAFRGTVDQWRTVQQQVEASLASITQCLAAAGRQYSEVELANLSMFR